MRILIVEDDAFKLTRIKAVVENMAEGEPIADAASLQAAMDKLSREHFDVVLLDMALPSHSGEPGSSDIYSQPVGGLDVLLYLSFNERKEKVVILTQYPTVEYDREHVPLNKLREKLISDDIENVLDAVFFSQDGSWEPKVSQALERLR